MAKQNINIGSQANDRSGDPLRTAFDKINQNFTELYTRTNDDIQIPLQTGNADKYLKTDGTTLSWSTVAGGAGGVSVSDFGEGFTDSLDAGKITTSKLYNENPNQGLNNLYVLEVTNGGVVILPDQSIINGATLKTIAGNYAGITAGPASPAGKDEDSWVWVDNNGATIATNYSTNAREWTFNNDGDLTLPAGGTINNTDGIILVTNRGTLAIGTNMEVPGIAGHFHIAFDGSNSQANANDLFLGDDYNYVKLPGYELNPADHGVEIGTNDRDGGDYHVWRFGTDGDLSIPPGKTIRDAMTGDDLLAGGGTTADSNIWVQTFVSDTPLLDFPQIATSVEYDSDGNVIGLFSHYDDSNDATYFSVGKYTPAGTKIWTARLSDDIQTDGWGLAVDSVDGWIYVAGQSDGVSETYPYSQATLTKIDPVNGSYDWHRVYDFGYDSASAVVDVDSTGNPIMVGYVDVDNDTDESYLAVTKISKTDGSVTWSRKLDGQADEEAYGMAVGPDDEVVAVGYMSQLAYGADNATVTVATAPGSNVNWVTAQTYTLASVELNITFNAGVPTITVDEDFIGGRTIGVTLGTILGSALGGEDGIDDMIVNVASVSAVGDQDDRIVVVKYLSDGTIDWQRAIQFDADLDCNGADADIDSLGNVYICGQYDTDGEIDTGMSLIKFNSAGVKQWSRRVTGNCFSTSTSIVVGPDDKLYLSGVNGDDVAQKFIWVVAKYSLDGLVEWQRFMENTTSWTFAGQFFNSLAGGSNLAVRQDYVALAGGFGDLSSGDPTYATLVQVPATGDVFTVGNWDFRAANLSGVLNASASDITVIDAGLTDSDNASTIEGGPIVGDTEVGNFLIGTLFTAPGGNNSLVNGANQLTLETTGAVTLPAGGTISEGYVTSNPTIQLTPASPSVASQKLVIKGGGSYSNTENGIYLSTGMITWAVSDTVEFYVYDPTRANETLYWWIVPEGAGISETMSGTVALDGIGDGNFTFTLDSDAYEFTVRVSPEDNNYDPDNTGVESVLLNADEPTFDGEHQLHLTTGNLTETSIFLGTDDHNVRTTTDGNIEINTPGIVTVDGIVLQGTGYTDGSYTDQATTGGSGTGLTVDYLVVTNQVVTVTINQQGLGYNNGDVITIPGGSSSATVLLDVAANNVWKFDTAGTATLPQGGVISETEVNSSHSILLTPKVQSGANPDMAVKIYPTFNDDDHIHITAGNPTTVDLFLGDDDQYVKIEQDGGNIVVGTNNDTHNWTFDVNGRLTLPKNSSVREVTPATGAAANVIVIQSASSILNTSFASLPPAPINNYNVPGTGIVVNVTWSTNGEDYHAPGFVVVNGGTGHTGGGESGGGDVLTVPFVDMGITGGGNWTWYVADIASDVVLAAGLDDWTFGGDGDLTLPVDGDIVNGAGESFLKDIPQNSPTGYTVNPYVLQASDRGRHILIDGSEGNSIEIPTNDTEPMPVGSAIVLVIKPGEYTVFVSAEDLGAMVIHGAGVGSNMVYYFDAINGGAMATLVKIGANEWMISGTGLAEYTGP
jgi:hypothetical protein